MILKVFLPSVLQSVCHRLSNQSVYLVKQQTVTSKWFSNSSEVNGFGCRKDMYCDKRNSGVRHVNCVHVSLCQDVCVFGDRLIVIYAGLVCCYCT